ncbi:MAG: hypothetical protein ACFUZC_18875 [Chthoniobacteraceae bacterium]
MEKQPLPCDAGLSKEEIEFVDKAHNRLGGVGRFTKTYPLELLAATASRLLEGEEYEDAVFRAAWLLKTCEEFLEHASKNKAHIEESAKQTKAKIAESRTSKRIPFSSALEKIYKRSKRYLNLDAHRAFIGYKFKETGDYQYSAEFIAQDEDQGFLPSEVERLRGEYEAIPSGKWRAIMIEYNRHKTPLEENAWSAPKKASTGKRQQATGKKQPTGK